MLGINTIVNGQIYCTTEPCTTTTDDAGNTFGSTSIQAPLAELASFSVQSRSIGQHRSTSWIVL